MANPKTKDLNFHFHCGLGMGGILGFVLGMLFIMVFVDDNLHRANQFWDEQLANQTANMKDDSKHWIKIAEDVDLANSFIAKAQHLYEDAAEQDKISKDKALMMGHMMEHWEKTHIEGNPERQTQP